MRRGGTRLIEFGKTGGGGLLKRLQVVSMPFGMLSRESRASSWAEVRFLTMTTPNSDLIRIIPDGLTQVFSTIKVTPRVEDLPSNYKAVLEWARMS